MVGFEQTHKDLFKAAWEGEVKSTKSLLAKGTNANIEDSTGATPLLYAAFRGHEEIVESLISNGAKVNAQDISGKTALFYSILNGHEDIIEFLLGKGADVNLGDQDGRTPLLVAHSLGLTRIEVLLRRRGAREYIDSICTPDGVYSARNLQLGL
jgi:ankyrin repeat protein